ncbi:MAG: hypothetical protein K8S16_17125 [Bacteroidales bacterium]|nr:hypothetical protein [Bacteroidales bacterium]
MKKLLLVKKYLTMKGVATPLSNLQLEILKLYSTNLDKTELTELKNQLADFYAKKSIGNANRVWKEKKLTNDDMDKWLNDE